MRTHPCNAIVTQGPTNILLVVRSPFSRYDIAASGADAGDECRTSHHGGSPLGHRKRQKHKVTGASQVIPQPITNPAHPGLSCQIGRDGELYRRYEPCMEIGRFLSYIYNTETYPSSSHPITRHFIRYPCSKRSPQVLAPPAATMGRSRPPSRLICTAGQLAQAGPSLSPALRVQA